MFSSAQTERNLWKKLVKTSDEFVNELTSNWFLLAKDLPKLMGAGPNALPNTKGGAILTYGNNVYDLSCNTSSGCKWTENKNQKLAIPRNYHVGISVSAETVLKCWMYSSLIMSEIKLTRNVHSSIVYWLVIFYSCIYSFYECEQQARVVEMGGMPHQN